MTTRQKTRLHELLAAALASGALKPELEACVAEYLVTGAVKIRATCPLISESHIAYSAWLTLLWTTIPGDQTDNIADALSRLRSDLKAEGIIV
jgi:hypothetical protein